MRVARTGLLVPGTMIAAGGCRGDHAPSSPVSITDSAGVSLVTSTAPEWTDATALRVAARPDLS